MITLSTMIVLAALLAVPLAWLVPGPRGIDAVAVLAAMVLAWVSPLGAAWIAGFSILLPPAMRWAERHGGRGWLAAVAVGLALAVFASAQLSHGIAWVGGAFFTLRLIHVIAEWWMEKIPAPGIAAHLRYQLFLPALFVGPVHRLPAFERQCARRRWDWPQFLSGAERVLLGAVSAELIGNVLIQHGRANIDAALQQVSPFLLDWVLSAFDWIALYFTFAGMSAIALGIAAMMGIVLEENFNKPWRARDLLDFWSRWHISLTNWCRDYVYRPIMALTRNTAIGLVAAMLAIGLWHEISAYYVLWSVWQSLGVVLSRTVLPRLTVPVSPHLRAVLAPVAILGWLALARPVITLLFKAVQ
ncbi:MAG: MBOAT family O-acyltransferase [Novosphingobium sp.]|uniref:MBOAT family O-acyltransferase n=1 Tax=Novosphingobium sp. TaxID=1874826 RepID=UPI0032BCD34D